MKKDNHLHFLKHLLIVIFVLTLFFGFACISLVHAGENEEEEEEEQQDNSLINTLNDGNIKYMEFLKETTFNMSSSNKVVTFEEYNTTASVSSDIEGYSNSYMYLKSKDVYTFHVNVDTAGLYIFQLDYYLSSTSIVDTEVSMSINSDIQYYELNQLVFQGDWIPDNEEFLVDRYGNEIVPTYSRSAKWYIQEHLVDGSGLNNGPMYIGLKAGSNEITIRVKSGEVYIGNIYLSQKEENITYSEYLNNHQDVKTYSGDIIKKGVEYIYSKSSLDIRVYSFQDKLTSRYHTTKKLLNAVYEQSFNDGNQSITWAIDVPETAMYAISFKFLQDAFINMPVERNIYINGEIPFKELENYYFYYSKKWQNETLSGEDDYLIYLEQGTNYITLEVTLTIFQHVVNEIDRIMDEMSAMALQIKYLTNGQSDKYRNWNISSYIPELESELNRWADELDQLRDYLKEYSSDDSYSQTFSNLKLAGKKLRKLAKDPDQIANNMTLFTDGSASVSQLLGDLILTFNSGPLGLEQIYLSSPDAKLPKVRSNIFVRFFEGVKRFFASFFVKEYSINSADKDELEIWVNRSRQYVEIMQQMADSAGIKAKFSIMPDENKLILANTSGDLPDVALGVSNWLIFNLALRGIVEDLRGYSNYEEFVSHFSKGAMIPYAYEDGMYGVPETQDFWVTYYRTDIYSSLGLDVPKSWDELLGQLPILQRLGYNFYSPISSYRGLKPYVATLPMFYQFGAQQKYNGIFTGSLYSEDGMSTTLSDEWAVDAMKFITDLFTIYDVPEETLSFYNSFRYGTLPVGIANSATYTQLLIAAPEINGNWKVSSHIGLKDSDTNEIISLSSAGSQGISMFTSSNKKDQAWEFITWWMSKDTQTSFIQRLYGMYGLEYLWYSANLDAFSELPIDNDDKEVMLTQLKEGAIEASRIPASYMLERSISDAYSRIVFNGQNVRIALDDAVIESNREIIRKNEEFKYMVNGVKVKDFIIPNMNNIEDWLKKKE